MSSAGRGFEVSQAAASSKKDMSTVAALRTGLAAVFAGQQPEAPNIDVGVWLKQIKDMNLGSGGSSIQNSGTPGGTTPAPRPYNGRVNAGGSVYTV